MKILRSIIILFIVLTGFNLQINAQQTGKITGIVYEDKSNKVIPDVEIILNPLKTGTVTGHNGKFAFNDILPGTYKIIISHVGYINQSKKINLSENQILNLTFFLVQKVQKLDEFIIEDEYINNTPYKIDFIDKINIRESAASDIGIFLRSTPNVSGIRKGGTNVDPVIRGFKFSQVNVFINNGIKIEGGCPNRMDPASSHIDINDISEIKIFKGPYALRFGPNLGGVVSIKTIQPGPYKKFQTEITAIQGFESNWNGSKQHLSIKGGNRFIYFDLSGNYNKYGNYTAGNSEIISSEFKKYNYTAQLGFSPVNNHNFIFSYDESFGRNVMFPALPMDERTDDTRIMSFDYSAKQISNKINSINFTAYLSKVDHVMDNKNRPFSDTVVAVSAINANNYGYRAELDLNFGNDHLFVGTDNENILKDGERTKSLILEPYLPVKIEKLWDNAKIRNFGVFAEYKTTLSVIKLMAALRLDFNDASCDKMELKAMNGKVIYSNPDVSSNFINFSFSAGAIYDFNSNTTINLALGHSARNPDMVERFIILLPVGYDNFDYLGNPQLIPEENNQIDVSVNYRQNKTGTFYFDIFYSYVTNFITGKEIPPSIVKPQSKGVVGVKQFYNVDHVFLYGFEFSYASPENNKLGITAVASITRGINPLSTKYIIENNQVVGEEKIKNDPLPEIPPFESFISVFYKFLDSRIIPKISVRLVAAQNQISQAYYETETPGFVLADFSVNYKYNKYLSLSAGVNNIFNKAYYEHLNRRIIGSKQPLYEPGRVFFVNLILKI